MRAALGNSASLCSLKCMTRHDTSFLPLATRLARETYWPAFFNFTHALLSSVLC